MAKMARMALTTIFATSLLSAPVAFAAESGATSQGGSTAGNAGSSGDKADKNMQDNSMSSDKDKQHK